jgi:hypothetical protein
MQSDLDNWFGHAVVLLRRSTDETSEIADIRYDAHLHNFERAPAALRCLELPYPTGQAACLTVLPSEGTVKKHMIRAHPSLTHVQLTHKSGDPLRMIPSSRNDSSVISGRRRNSVFPDASH